MIQESGRIFRLIIVFCWLAVVSSTGYAQLQTSYWSTNGSQLLDVSNHPPQVIGSNFHDGHRFGAIADNDGNLLFYTDGSKFYDKDNNLIGTAGIEFSFAWEICAVPYPEKPNVYNVFFTGFIDNNPSKEACLFHSIVDLNKTSNASSPRQIISKGMHGTYRVNATKTSNCQSYWVIATAWDTLKAFYVDREGINTSPVNSKIYEMNGGFISQFKIAPDGKTTALFEGYTYPPLYFADFDESTGEFSVRIRKNETDGYSTASNSLEFSPDSRNLFIMSDSVWNDPNPLIGVRSNYNLWVYRAQSGTINELDSSKILLYEERNVIGFDLGMQLTPTGKIYLGFSGGGWNTGYISSINNPNAETKEGFDYKNKIVTNLAYPNPPQFPAYYFQNLNYSPVEFPLDLGNDMLVCRDENIVLGDSLLNHYTYTWTSNGNLSATNVATPVLIGISTPSVSYDTIVNYVVAYDSLCNHGLDTIRVVYVPASVSEIHGSKSVCPGVNEVSYWLEGDAAKNDSITWAIVGGELFENFHDSVTVNWGNTNFSAHVHTTAINSYGCPDLIDPFPVIIYKYLETEKPSGIDTLPCAVATHPYRIQGTNGSVYDWSTINGQIIQGNGTNQVMITWDLNHKYQSVWIDESVNTELETCFGKSDTLHIVNPLAFGDENIHLYAISSDLNDASKVSLHYEIENPLFFAPVSEVFWKPKAAQFWETPFTVNNLKKIYEHQFDKDVADEYYFQLVTHNSCNIKAKSRINSNIFLTLEKNSTNETLLLAWNKPIAWSNADSYEIYRMKDDEQFMLYDAVPGNVFQKTITNTLDGFHFQYYISGISSVDSPILSLSNKVGASFEHVPFIPNVITPNGDNLNDYLVIEKLELYPNSQLSIYNRYGEKVFEQSNYQNTWNGEGLPSGIYYYFLNIHRDSQTLKGWIHVMR
jgi:gliding motility-associated-like protein